MTDGVDGASAVTDAQLIAAARSYVEALATHDPSQVPFAADCTRTELGVKTGRSGDHLRRSLTNGPQYRVIKYVSDFTPRVSGGIVYSTFYVNVLFGLRSKVTERFEFNAAGEIARIVATFGLPHR
jgi:hypothetical protein